MPRFTRPTVLKIPQTLTFSAFAGSLWGHGTARVIPRVVSNGSLTLSREADRSKQPITRRSNARESRCTVFDNAEYDNAVQRCRFDRSSGKPNLAVGNLLDHVQARMESHEKSRPRHEMRLPRPRSRSAPSVDEGFRSAESVSRRLSQTYVSLRDSCLTERPTAIALQGVQFSDAWRRCRQLGRRPGMPF